MLRILLALWCFALLVACGRNSRTDDDAFFGITTTDHPSYTYFDYGQCMQLCDVPCTRTVVTFQDGKQVDMFNCIRLKVIKTSFMDNLKGGTFQNAMIGVVVITIIALLSIVCIYYCCCSRRDEDKYHGRDEFRELGPHDERKALNKGSSVIEV